MFQALFFLYNFSQTQGTQNSLLVDESFVPAKQRTSVVYRRFLDFKITCHFNCLGQCLFFFSFHFLVSEWQKYFHLKTQKFFTFSIGYFLTIIKKSPQQQQTDLWRGVAFQIESWYQIRTDYSLSLNTNCFFLFGFLDTYVLMKKYFVIMIIHIK